jgi:hypothetical protein
MKESAPRRVVIRKHGSGAAYIGNNETINDTKTKSFLRAGATETLK